MKSLRLMVVDADDYGAMLTGAALSELGHRVEKFSNAEIALEALRYMPGAYDAVVTRSGALDTMTGLQFAREAQINDANLRLLEASHKMLYVLPQAHLMANAAATVARLCIASEESMRLAA